MITLAVLLWCGAAIGGMALLAGKANRAGEGAEPPSRWPAESRIRHSKALPTVVLFAHPRCPCTSATLFEFDRLLARHPEGINAHVAFMTPHSVGEEWEETALRRRAAAIPGVTVHRDDDGAEARRFGSATSGQVIAYNKQGGLIFGGGITSARGHAGDNRGRDLLEAVLAGKLASSPPSPVFGCPLFDADFEEISK